MKKNNYFGEKKEKLSQFNNIDMFPPVQKKPPPTP